MFSPKTIAIGACFAVLTSLPMAASALDLECLLRDERSTGGWIPLQTRMSLNTAAKTATVKFPTNAGTVSQTGKIKLDNAKRTVVEFGSDHLKDSKGQVARFVYTVNIFKNDLSVNVTATPLGYTNRFRGKGRCRQI